MLFQSRLIAWAVWLTASIFYAYQYIIRVMPNIMLPEIMQQFHIDVATFGQFSGVYYLGYALMHIPLGIMLDRFGPRKIMSGCILLTVAGLLPILFSDYWAYPVLGRALIGMGSSAAILSAFKIIRLSFSEQRFARMLSLSVTIGLLGAIYGGAPVAYLCQTLGYQAVVKIFALIGLALAGITYLIVPEIPQTHAASIKQDMLSVLRNRRVLLCCLSAGFMVGPLEGFADVWGTEFLKQIYGFQPSLAAILPSMIFIGMCFGGPLLSVIAEKTGHYLLAVATSGLLMMLSFMALISGYLNPETMALDFLLVGVCCAYQILAIYKASTYVPERMAGLTTAVANMIIMSFGYGVHALIGFIIKTLGGPQVPASFIGGLALIPALLSVGVLGFIVLMFIENQKE